MPEAVAVALEAVAAPEAKAEAELMETTALAQRRPADAMLARNGARPSCRSRSVSQEQPEPPMRVAS